MSDERHDPFTDVINVLAAPIAGGLRSVEQFQKGVGELFRAVENLNRTLENLNETATRVNRLIGDIEEPVRAMIPQLTRSIEAADEMTKVLQGPVRAAAPNIEKVVDTLSSPGFSALPNQLGEFANVIGETSKRLAPLAQFAENAGGLFGGFKLPGMPGQARPDTPTAPPPSTTATAKKTPAKKTPANQTTANKSPAKKSTAKKAAAKKSTKKPTAKKSSAS